MKVLMHQTYLREVLDKVVSVIKKNSLAGLECVKLQVENGSVKATATDLNIWLRAEATCQTDEEGIVVVSGKELAEISKLLPEEDVSLETKDKQLVIKSNGSKFKLPLANPKDYPIEKPLPGSNGIYIPRTELQSAMSSVSALTGKETYSSVLSGTLFDFRKDKLILVGTDGHRLAEIGISGEFEQEQKLVVPSDIAKHLRKMEAHTIQVLVDKTMIGFSSGNLTVVTRLLEGDYPPYESVIPDDNDKLMIIGREKLIQGLKQVEVFAQKSNELAKLKIDKGANELALTSAAEGCESVVRVECKYTGDALEIGFNAKYLLDIVSAIKGEQVKWSFKNPVSPMILKPDNSENEHLYLLMPVRFE